MQNAEFEANMQELNIAPLYFLAALTVFEFERVTEFIDNKSGCFCRNFSGFTLWFFENTKNIDVYFEGSIRKAYTFKSIGEIKELIPVPFDTEVLQHETLLYTVRLMRRAQKKYFSTKGKLALAESKRLEQKVDTMITAHYTPDTQNLLF